MENQGSSRYIPIGEFARRVNKSVETLRSWHKTGKLIPAVKKGELGHRFYTEEQVQQVLGWEHTGKVMPPSYNSEFVKKMDQVLDMLTSVNTKVTGIKQEESEVEEESLSVRIQDVIEDAENLPDSDDRDLAVIRLREAYIMLKRSGAFSPDDDEDGASVKEPEPVG